MSLREAVNVPDLMERDALVRRMAKLRAEVVLDLNTINHWNRTHPEEEPLDASFEVAVIAWCDGGGVGPIPVPPREHTTAEGGTDGGR